MSFYVYQITNKITGEFYFGSRTAKVMISRTPEEDLWNHYFTSSKYIKQQIEQYGIKSFETEILHKYPDNADAAYWHEQLHIMASIKNPLCLNKFYVFIMTAKSKMVGSSSSKFSDLARQRALENKIGKPRSAETKVKLSLANKGKEQSLETRAKRAASHKGKKHSDETREKIRLAWVIRKQREKQENEK